MENLHLDVMRDPWMKIQWLDGKTEEVSLYTAITESHNIKRIMPVGYNKFTTYVLIGFVIDFIQWVYKPVAYDTESAQEAIVEMYEQGCFDKATLDEYINYFENELHHSFDIYDEERPFLQLSKEEADYIKKKYEKSKSLIASLSSDKFGLERLSGNNVIFAHPRNIISYDDYQAMTEANNGVAPAIEDTYSLTPEDIVLSLIYSLSFSQTSGSLASIATSGDKGLHPITVLNEGDNLFTTICASIGTAEQYTYPPVWEQDTYVNAAPAIIKQAETDHNSVSLTYLPSAYVHLEGSNRSIGKQLDDAKKNKTAPKFAYPLWISCYPRIIRAYQFGQYGAGKKGEKSALVYNFCDIQKDVDSKNAIPVLKTRLLQLGMFAESCTVIAVNQTALSDYDPSINLQTKFYVCTHTNTSCRTSDMSKIIEWPKGKEFVKTVSSRETMTSILENLAKLAQYTGITLTAAYGRAKQSVRKATDGTYKIGGKKITKYVTIVDTAVQQAIDKCMWMLENKYYSDLLDVQDGQELRKAIMAEFQHEFKNVLDRHIQTVAGLSMLDRVEIKDLWYRKIKKLGGQSETDAKQNKPEK